MSLIGKQCLKNGRMMQLSRNIQNKIKKNRNLDCSGLGLSLHIRGSIPISNHKRKHVSNILSLCVHFLKWHI